MNKIMHLAIVLFSATSLTTSVFAGRGDIGADTSSPAPVQPVVTPVVTPIPSDTTDTTEDTDPNMDPDTNADNNTTNQTAELSKGQTAGLAVGGATLGLAGLAIASRPKKVAPKKFEEPKTNSPGNPDPILNDPHNSNDSPIIPKNDTLSKEHIESLSTRIDTISNEAKKRNVETDTLVTVAKEVASAPAHEKKTALEKFANTPGEERLKKALHKVLTVDRAELETKAVSKHSQSKQREEIR